MLTKVLDHGTLHIKNEVIARIINVCIEEMEGVDIVSRLKDGVAGMVNRNFYKNGSTIIENEEQLEIEVKVVLQYGKNIPETCELLQAQIKQEIESLTELQINTIKVKVEELSAKV